MKDMELEEMRKQIGILKDKVEKQRIINTRLLENSMKSRASLIHLQGYKNVVCGMVCIIIFIGLHFAIRLNLTFVIFTIFMMMFCVWGKWYCHLPLREKDFMGQDVRTTILAFSKVKRRYEIWLHYISPPLIIIWVLWCCYEYSRVMNLPEKYAIYFYIVVAVSVVIGLFIGYSWHRKVVNACDEAISQLEET